MVLCYFFIEYRKGRFHSCNDVIGHFVSIFSNCCHTRSDVSVCLVVWLHGSLLFFFCLLSIGMVGARTYYNTNTYDV